MFPRFKSRQNDPLYEANKEISENFREGLSKMTGMKSKKIALEKINMISSKADYSLFEKDIEKSQRVQQNPNQTLFG